MNDKNHHERAREFLGVADRFRLGHLPTEQPHPLTRELSAWARSDLPRAVSVLKQVDLQALQTLESYAGEIDRLARKVRATLACGKRIFLCGCGATGRLSLSLEFLWRKRKGGRDRLRSFMAGGDVALVHALEGFEDHPAYGARHLEQMGFVDGDLLISSTEGGETPYVIGATQRAAQLSSNPPSFLYCNDDAALIERIERFRQVHENPRIDKLCLYVGPMALTGSTRMQASTVLQLAIGLALLHPDRSAAEQISRFRQQLREVDLAFLPKLIEQESDIYASGQRVTYRVKDYGITVFTDTTERAPTFGLLPFDQLEARRAESSLCYVALDDADGAPGAWSRLLNRRPRALNWPEVDPRTTADYLYGFDFSLKALEKRRRQTPGVEHHDFRINGAGRAIEFHLDGLSHRVGLDGQPELFRHLLLKQILNIHSTLVMGRLGRYQSNLMTWVLPTNNKLVDRAARYVQHLLSHDGRNDPRYEEIVQQLFAEMERPRPDQSIVLRTYRSLSRRRGWGQTPSTRKPGMD